MTSDKAAELELLLSDAPHTRHVVGAVLEVWPEHAAYLVKSFAPRSPEMMQATEAASGRSGA